MASRRAPAAVVLGISAAMAACSWLAPGDNELLGSGQPVGRGGSPPQTDGGASPTAGSDNQVAGASSDVGSGGDANAGASANSNAGAGGASNAGASGDSNAGAGGDSGAGACGILTCGPNKTCTSANGLAICECRVGFVANGTDCRPPVSCRELHSVFPSIISGEQVLRPPLAIQDLKVYCEMSVEGGGWTLVLNQDSAFDPTVTGTNEVCRTTNCTGLAYSTVLINADLMLDMKNANIIDDVLLGRAVITGIQTAARAKTLRELFTGSQPYFIEQENNANVKVSGCGSLPADIQSVLCTSCVSASTSCFPDVLVFGDDERARPIADCKGLTRAKFAIGAAHSFTQPWPNCAGWPQGPIFANYSYYPSNFRIWVR